MSSSSQQFNLPKSGNDFGVFIQTIFEKYPIIDSISLTGFTPRFNDGDKCIHIQECPEIYSKNPLEIHQRNEIEQGFKSFSGFLYKQYQTDWELVITSTQILFYTYYGYY